MPDRPNGKEPALAALTPPSAQPFSAAARMGASDRFVTGAIFGGRYRVITLLRVDGSGEVWRADDLVLQTPVALKILPPAAAHARAGILEEVKLARQVTHPAVCRVFDVGEAEGCVFYSMELVDGEDLATLTRRVGRLPVEKVADIGGQLCEALAAAHANRVLHLNLKPANVFLDNDGFVRVADFGIVRNETVPMTDRAYRAPEQLDPPGGEAPRSGQVSERTDLYAVGALLFELLAGEPPSVDGASFSRPARLSKLIPEIDARLERVIADALSRDPKQRPASAAVMADRLRSSMVPRQRTWPPLAFGLALVVIAILGLLFYRRTTPPLSDRDTTVVADFANTTGEPVFDGALKVALAVALEQSPFLKVFPDERVRETLRLMERSPDERVTRALAREIAVREQLKALVAGSIAKLGNHYVLTLEAVNAQSGDVIAREQAEIATREDVLSALGTAATKLRGTLGESLASVQRFDVPLARATTGSLEALHAYSLALDDGRMNLRVEAIPHLQRAIELDPQFALAQALLSGIYANTGRTGEAPAFARRAFELRDRVSERERFFISWRYYIDSAQAWDQALDLATSWTRTYPREAFAFNSLGMASGAFGRLDTAADAFRTALRLDPRFVPPHGNLVGTLIALGHFDEARIAIRDARSQGIDALSLRRASHLLAWLAGDQGAIATALADARRAPDSALQSLSWEAHTAAFAGQMRAAHDMFERAIGESTNAGAREQAGQWTAEDAENDAVVGQCAEARREVVTALELSRDNFTLERSARTLAICGGASEAQSLSAELGRRFPEATLTQRLHRPVIEAILSLQTQPARAIDLLDAVRPYDGAPAAEFWPNYVRGLAYLGVKDGRKAIAEFQRIIDHRGQAPTSPLYALATLGAARGAVIAGDQQAARKSYDAFFGLWNQADAGLAPVDAARREYNALQ